MTGARKLQRTPLKISASIMSGDYTNLAAEIARLEEIGIDSLHLDIMDGVFVPNLTFGADFCKALRPLTKLPFDAHLMVVNPDKYVEPFAAAGVNSLTVHQEACIHLDRTLEFIKSHGMKAGVAINPATHESSIEYVLDKLDLILIMSVNPGFSGQSFLASQIQKIANLRQMLDARNLATEVWVDGGIDDKTVPLVKNAGATAVVSGSYLFKHANRKQAVLSLR